MVVSRGMATPASSVSNSPPPTPLHGIKRRADDGLESEQRLAKRFDLLNLDQNGKLWIPPHALQPSLARHSTPQNLNKPVRAVPSPSVAASATTGADASHNAQSDPAPLPAPGLGDGMQVEDTPHRVYVSDLDEELASIPPEEPAPSLAGGWSSDGGTMGNLVFLPDIEAHLSRLPKHVLYDDAEQSRAQQQQHHQGNELVLYGVPSSLSVPEADDSVRKAILESRARMTEEHNERWGWNEDRSGTPAKEDRQHHSGQRPRRNALVQGVDTSVDGVDFSLANGVPGREFPSRQAYYNDMNDDGGDYDAMDMS